MEIFLLHRSQSNLPRFVALSTVLHILVIGILVYFASLTPLRRFITPVYTVDLLGPIAERTRESAIKPLEEAREATTRQLPVEQPKPIPKLTGKVVEKKLPLKKEEKVNIDIAIKRIEEKVLKEEEEETQVKKRIDEIEVEAKVQKRIDELKMEIAKREATAKKLVEIKVKTPVEDTVPASGVTGEITRELIDLEFNAYYLKLREAIYAHWVFPNDSSKDMIAIIGIKIGRYGNVLEKWFEKSSGSIAYDSSVMRAIEKALPFPQLPNVFKDDFMELGVRFCPYGCVEE